MISYSTLNINTACERDENLLDFVSPVVLLVFPSFITSFKNSSSLIYTHCKPSTHTPCLQSSLISKSSVFVCKRSLILSLYTSKNAIFTLIDSTLSSLISLRTNSKLHKITPFSDVINSVYKSISVSKLPNIV